MPLDSTILEPMYRTLEELTATGTPPGIVTLIAQGDDMDVRAFGMIAKDSDTPIKDDAIFRIQSMTKPITATAIMQLIEKGTLSLDAPVDRWLPELADRRVLRRPNSALDDTVPAERAITVEDLLRLTAGYGMILDDPGDSPIRQAMIDADVDVGPAPHMVGADEWLGRFAELPLVGQPGAVWRYHIPYDMLGVLIARVTDHPYRDYLKSNVLEPLDMVDTDFWASDAERLPAAYQVGEGGELAEFEPVGGGAWSRDPGFDVSHWELVSTARDYCRFGTMLLNGGELDGERILSPESVVAITTDHVMDHLKTDDSFFPGFWKENGWGFGMCVTTVGEHTGRYGWSGGLGTDWQNDPESGVVAVFLTQIEMGPRYFEVAAPFMTAIESLRTGR